MPVAMCCILPDHFFNESRLILCVPANNPKVAGNDQQVLQKFLGHVESMAGGACRSTPATAVAMAIVVVLL